MMTTHITIYRGLEIYYDVHGSIRVQYSDQIFTTVDKAKQWIEQEYKAGNIKYD